MTSGDPVFQEAARTAAFWEALRAFLHRSEQVARKHGLTPQRQQLLVMIAGAPDARSTVSDLARRLQLAQSTVTELVARGEEAGLIARETSEDDARVNHLRLTGEGYRRMAAVMAELRSDRSTLEAIMAALEDPER